MIEEGEERKVKKTYSIKFFEKFRNELMLVAEAEGISFNALAERELGRYLRACKVASREFLRRKEIEGNINNEKNG